MSDTKKILIAAISVVLVVAIVAGVSIGVLAGTVNGMKDQIADLNQTVETLQSENDAMEAEIKAATENNEKLVTAEDFEAKLAAAIGEQNQTMQALVSTAVKNQIEELGVEGLTEAQVKEIINAAVANCITEDEVNELIANSDTGLTEAEVKKLISNATAGNLTYAQIVNLIDENIYGLRNYLEGLINGKTTTLYIDAEDIDGDTYTLDDDVLATVISGGYVELLGDWTEINLVVDYDDDKEIWIWAETPVATLKNKVPEKAYAQVVALEASVSSVEDLEAALSNVYTITIEDDIEWTLEDNIGLEDGQRIVIAEDVEVVIDLNGNTLSGATHKTVGAVITNNGDLTIIGGEVISGTPNGGSAVANYGDLVLENCEIIGATQSSDDDLTTNKWPSYPINHYEGTLTVNGGYIEGTHGGVSVGKNATATINDVEITVLNWGSSCHVFYTGGTLTVNGGTFTQNGDGSLAYVYGGVTVLNGGTFVGQDGGYGPATTAGTLTINGGSFNSSILDWGGEVSITGGTFAKDPSAFVPEGYQAVQSGDVWGVIPNEADVAFAASPEDLATAITNGATQVSLAGDMTIVADNLKNASDLTVVLGSDTTVTVASGAAGSKNLTFTGDKSSSVVLVNEDPGYEGKLSYQDNANLTFKGITFDASQISGICARGGVVTFEDCIITGELKQTIASKFVFSGCTFTGGVTQAGYGCSDVVFEDCKFETDGYGIKIYSEGHTPLNLTVTNCSFKNTGSTAKSAIFLDHIVDGITYNITVENCTFDGFTATPAPNENKWAERMIVEDSFVKTDDGQYIFSYQTGAEGGKYHKILTDTALVVTVK